MFAVQLLDDCSDSASALAGQQEHLIARVALVLKFSPLYSLRTALHRE
jgi:hypothetical protein